MESNEEKKVLCSEAEEADDEQKESRELADSELEEIAGGQTVPQSGSGPSGQPSL